MRYGALLPRVCCLSVLVWPVLRGQDVPVTTLKQDPEGANMAQIVRYLFGLGAAAPRCPVDASAARGPALAATIGRENDS